MLILLLKISVSSSSSVNESVILTPDDICIGLFLFVQQTKKSNKFQCKLCGEKQSIKRHYGIGTAKDCRLHVQKLNCLRGEINELTDSNASVLSDNDEDEEETSKETRNEGPKFAKSKWSNFIDNNEEVKEEDPNDTMYLNNTEVVLEIPKKRRKNNFKCPKRTSENINCEDYVGELPVNKTQTAVPSKNSGFSPKNTNILNTPIAVDENVKPEPKFKQPPAAPSVVIKKELPKTYVPPAVTSNSKWAQFVDDEGENTETDEHFDTSEVPSNDENVHDQIHCQELFALCDDNDLDDVLDF